VIPRAVVPPPGGPLGAMCIECTGEGIVLVEPAPPAPGDDDAPAARTEPRLRPAGAVAAAPAAADRTARLERGGEPPAADSFGRLDEL
jgi:hypothetical protein